MVTSNKNVLLSTNNRVIVKPNYLPTRHPRSVLKPILKPNKNSKRYFESTINHILNKEKRNLHRENRRAAHEEYYKQQNINKAKFQQDIVITMWEFFIVNTPLGINSQFFYFFVDYFEERIKWQSLHALTFNFFLNCDDFSLYSTTCVALIDHILKWIDKWTEQNCVIYKTKRIKRDFLRLRNGFI